MAFLIASTAMARVVRRESRLYSVSPTPTMQYRSFRRPMTREYTPAPVPSAWTARMVPSRPACPSKRPRIISSQGHEHGVQFPSGARGMSVMLVGIATSADSPPQLRGKVVELDRFSAQVALETREPALRQGASVWLHFDPPGGGSPLSVGGIISGVAPRRGGARLSWFRHPSRRRRRPRGQPWSPTLPA